MRVFIEPVTVGQAHAELGRADDRHRRELLPRAPRGPVGRLVGLVGERPAFDRGAVDDADAVVFGAVSRRRRAGPVDGVDREQFDDPPDETGLLVELADRAGFGMLAEIDAAARERPRARAPR